MIFQRLHERSAYAGTGIGLSMTRKIIEYFGGRIWLDTTYHRRHAVLLHPADAAGNDDPRA